MSKIKFFSRAKTLCIVVYGGVSDALLCTAHFQQLRQKYADHRIEVYCGIPEQRQVFLHNPSIDRIYSSPWQSRLAAIRARYLTYKTAFRTSYPPFYPGLIPRHATQTIGELLGLEAGGGKLELYLTPREEEKAMSFLAAFSRPVALHIAGSFTTNQEWQPSRWEELVRRTTGYDFIQLGGSGEPKVEGAIDMRGKTNFRGSLALLKHCKGFVGIDSHFAHATNAFDVPGVVLFGASSPDIWGHPNNVNLFKQWRCSPCIDRLFTSKCPFGKGCMEAIGVGDVSDALRRQLGGEAQINHLFNKEKSDSHERRF
jgi:ADP-heptose:LPS heptosyltransferase